MTSRLMGLILAVMLVVPVIAAAQKVEGAKDREPGDRVTSKCVENNKTAILEENWTALTDDEMVGVRG